MLAQLGLLMTFQLIGEAVVSLAGIPFPGPLCGMLLLLGYLCLRGGPCEDLSTMQQTGLLIDQVLGGNEKRRRDG